MIDLQNEPFKAITWGWTGEAGTWTGSKADYSLEQLLEQEFNWVVLAYAAVQQTAISTEIDSSVAVGREEIMDIVTRLHSAGLKVCLKPTVNVTDGTWRAHIGFFDEDVPGEPSWGEWFANYERFILEAADIAAASGCEMFSVGCEMVRADKHEAHWRDLISRVRDIYRGAVTYNCDKYQEDRLTWWDAVDVISSSGYYPQGSWPAQLERIGEVVGKYKKPFVFLEAGCPSRDASPARPNDWALPGVASEDAQAGYYQDMFANLRAVAWVNGLCIWDWPAALYSATDAKFNADYCPFAKSAMRIINQNFAEWN